MNARTLVRLVDDVRKQGVQIAIHAGELGMWVSPIDLIEERDGMLYWEHSNARTYFLPAELCWLELAPTAPAEVKS